MVETLNGEIIILRRFPGGTHEGVWQLDEDVFGILRRSKLVSRCKTAKYGNCGRQVFEWGPRTFETISDYHRYLLARTMEQVREKQRLAVETPPAAPNQPSASRAAAPLDASIRRTNVFPFPAPTPEGGTKAFAPPLVPWSGRTHRRLKNPVDPSSVAAYDDDGKPILESEVARERTRTVPRNMPTNLIPDAPDGCSDDEWERLMLIEQIKYRRRVSAKLASGGKAY
ncbi:hypothetical protein OIU34_23085 [Pararhizobium sp. BT-229]|uniref:hypothetical protein n=1 Tax=Pararhizobium sp. BT-229 TaxID=2986923 RepID=UPI0021F6ECC6|nr:hypothetical protein [Pararhizobium sp. BT-229]MCV9964780.1 hypothetical protein [Pararhizobium sp. BT-229]